MKANKGQAALEFLTTYGWAILAIALVAVIIVAYLSSRGCPAGVFKFEAQEVKVLDKQFPTSTSANLEITNVAGRTITLTDVDFNTTAGTFINGTITPVSIPNGQSRTVSVSLGTSLPNYANGACYSLDVLLTYNLEGGLSGKTAIGNLKGAYPS
jgi:uncharacterized protein (UPF0333 family)